MDSDQDPRTGEVRLAIDPANSASDGSVVFIGKIRSPWKARGDCPRNMTIARERGGGARLQVDEQWRPGLSGVTPGGKAVVLYWMHQARRDLIVQAPRHRSEPAGVFALRSPVRPNPIALATVHVEALDQVSGIVEIDAIDCIDGTPLLDIKPWFASIDEA